MVQLFDLTMPKVFCLSGQSDCESESLPGHKLCKCPLILTVWHPRTLPQGPSLQQLQNLLAGNVAGRP